MKYEWLTGFHAVTAQLDYNAIAIVRFLITDDRTDPRILKIKERLQQEKIPFEVVRRRVVDRCTLSANHQGIAARVQLTPLMEEAALFKHISNKTTGLLLILDGITDPHNFGACLRTAAAANIDAVVVSRHASAPLNNAARKAACGAAEQQLCIVQADNTARLLRRLKEEQFFLIGMTHTADRSLYEVNLSGKIAVVVGSEGKGMRRLTRESCDTLAAIPMSSHMVSLNVSVATGIALFEAVRQRMNVASV